MGYYQINTGGLVTALGHSIKGADGQWRPVEKDDLQNNRGTTTKLVDDDGKVVNPHPVANHRYHEPAWKRNDSERTERARNYFPGAQGADIERQLWNQVTGQSLSAAVVTPKIESDWSKLQSEFQRIDNLNRLLFQQLVDGNKQAKAELSRSRES